MIEYDQQVSSASSPISTLDALNVLESTLDGVIVLDRDWRFVYMNASARASIAAGPEILGKVIWEQFPTIRGRDFEDACRKAMADRVPTRCEDFAKTIGVWLESIIHPCDVGLIIYLRDISGKKRREHELLGSLDRLRGQFDELDAIYTHAPIGRALLSPDLRYLRVNKLIAEMNGISVEAHQSMNVRDVLPHLADSLEAVARRVVETGQPVRDVEVEDYSRSSDGLSRTWIEQWTPHKDANGKVVAINVVVEEVTERKRIERELRNKVEELQAVLDAVPAAVLLAEDRDCRVMTGNRMAEEMLRIPRGANASKAGTGTPPDYRILKNGVELDPFEMPIHQSAASGESISGFEATLSFDNGNVRHIYGNAAPLFDANGKTRGAVGACVDVTEMVEARQMALRTNAELERRVEARTRELLAANARLAHQIAEREKVEHALWQVQKQDAIGLLASGVAHDFNNILNVIAGSLKLIEMQKSEMPIDRYLKMAQGAVDRGTSLTQRLLTFVRTNRFTPTLIDANDLVLSVGELLKRTIGVEIEIKRVLSPDLWPVTIDKNQFELVLLNLAINARDAMPAGGLLTFESSNLSADDPTLPGEMDRRDCVCITITDTGHGMSADVLARVREPFFTTKPPGKGTGLGLSMVDGFVRQSGGTLRISSRVDIGTVVEIFLPRADARPENS